VILKSHCRSQSQPRIGQCGEVIQQRDPDRRSHDDAFIDEASNESNFQPRRKLPHSIQAIALQDNRLNCVGVRSDRLTLGLASRRPWRWDARKFFNTEFANGQGRIPMTENGGAAERYSGLGRIFMVGSKEDDGGRRSKGPKRFARSAQFAFYSVALDVLPPSSVLKFFLDCGRHRFPRLSEATADSSDCPEFGYPTSLAFWHARDTSHARAGTVIAGSRAAMTPNLLARARQRCTVWCVTPTARPTA
jgi:hypothetical protein